MCYIFEKLCQIYQLWHSRVSNERYTKGQNGLNLFYNCFQHSYLCSGFEDHSYNINTCKDHEISKVHFSKAPRCPTDAIFYCILVVLSIRPVAIKRFPQQCWITSWRSSSANETITWPFPIIALPTQVLWVIVMLLLLLVSCGFSLWQPTVIGYF